MNIFFGKFSTKYPEQIEQRFYAGGPEGGSWYGDVKSGDYVIPVYGGRISELWQADEYIKIPNRINSEGVLSFKKVLNIEETAVSTILKRVYKILKYLKLKRDKFKN